MAKIVYHKDAKKLIKNISNDSVTKYKKLFNLVLWLLIISVALNIGLCISMVG